MSSRNSIADLLKGIAVLGMVQVHILELFSTNEISTSYVGKILMFLGGPPVAPVYMILLGYFIFQSNKTSRQLFARGIKLVTLGMLLNLSLNCNLIIQVLKGAMQVNIWPYIFGVDILHFAGLAAIVIAILKKTLEKTIFVTITLIILSAFAGSFLTSFTTNGFAQYFSAYFYGSAWWSYFPLFPWLTYPLIGILFYQLQQKFDLNKIQNSSARFFGAIVFLFFMITTFIYVMNISSNLAAYYHHDILFALWTIIFIAFYSYFTNEINKIAGDIFLMKYFKWLGKNVTIIYVIQWILIGNTATAVYKTVSSPMYLALSFVVVLLTSSLLCMAYLKIKDKILTSS